MGKYVNIQAMTIHVFHILSLGLKFPQFPSHIIIVLSFIMLPFLLFLFKWTYSIESLFSCAHISAQLSNSLH